MCQNSINEDRIVLVTRGPLSYAAKLIDVLGDLKDGLVRTWHHAIFSDSSYLTRLDFSRFGELEREMVCFDGYVSGEGGIATCFVINEETVNGVQAMWIMNPSRYRRLDRPFYH